MNGRVFIDTNVFVYANIRTQQLDKHQTAVKLFQSFHGQSEIVISTQVVNEFYAVLLKNGFQDHEIQVLVRNIIDHSNVVLITIQTLELAWQLKTQYQLSYWDSLFVSSAKEYDCTQLITEDMQHELTIENSLQIINPFHL